MVMVGYNVDAKTPGDLSKMSVERQAVVFFLSASADPFFYNLSPFSQRTLFMVLKLSECEEESNGKFMLSSNGPL